MMGTDDDQPELPLMLDPRCPAVSIALNAAIDSTDVGKVAEVIDELADFLNSMCDKYELTTPDLLSALAVGVAGVVSEASDTRVDQAMTTMLFGRLFGTAMVMIREKRAGMHDGTGTVQ